MSDPYEVRECPQDLRFWGVWDNVRNAWAKKPYEEAAARRLCREMNEKARGAAARARIGEADSEERDAEPSVAPGPGSPLRDEGGEEADGRFPDIDGEADTSFEAVLAQLREAVARGMLEDFRQGGQEALAALRTERPHEYFKLQIALLRMEGPGADSEAIVTEFRSIIVDPHETGDPDENEED